MAPVMRLTLRWEDADNPSLDTVLKIKLPQAWKEGPTSQLKSLFIEHFNQKHPERPLTAPQTHLLNPKGEQLADEDIVIKVLLPSDTVRVRPGPPPTIDQVNEVRKAKSGSARKALGAKTVIDAQAEENDEEDNDNSSKIKDAEEDHAHVSTADELRKVAEAQEKKFAFDYSKWDRLDLSDDDGEDCHPNIDLASWKRLRGRQRDERRVQEQKKIDKYNAKIDKYKKKAAQLKAKLEKDETNIQVQIDLKEAEASQKEYEEKLEQFLESRKMTADDVCEVKESKGLVADDEVTRRVHAPSAIPDGPISEQKEYDNYDDFQKDNRKYLKQFATMRNDTQSEEFLLTHPSLLCDHAEGFLLILTLDTCMKHQLTDRDPTVHKSDEAKKQERLKEYTVGKQHLTVHYICELAKSMKRNPLDAVKPFYRKTGHKAEDRVEGFEEDLEKFLQRIRNRATEKIGNGEINPLVEPDASIVDPPKVLYEAAGVGPGGLDPNEVLKSLPDAVQEAFIEQNTDKLRAAFEAMTPEDADYHFKRCIDSGLWVPNQAEGDEEDYEEGEYEEGQELPNATSESADTRVEVSAPNASGAPIVDDIE